LYFDHMYAMYEDYCSYTRLRIMQGVEFDQGGFDNVKHTAQHECDMCPNYGLSGEQRRERMHEWQER